MKQYLPITEVASKLACSEDTVRRMIRSGRLPAIKLQQQWRVSETDISASLSPAASGSSRQRKQQH